MNRQWRLGSFQSLQLVCNSAPSQEASRVAVQLARPLVEGVGACRPTSQAGSPLGTTSTLTLMPTEPMRDARSLDVLLARIEVVERRVNG
jgi:hypothetical protein